MELVYRAAEFAAESHGDQMRKYTRERYIRHPERVARRVARLGLDDEAVAAAWLHDVVEDCDVGLEQLRLLFGPRVARLVDHLTEPPRRRGGPNRAARKRAYRQRLASLQGADARDAHTIKVADCLDNAPSVREHDPEFWTVYGRELAELAEVLTAADPGLLDELHRALGRRPGRRVRPPSA